MNKFFDLREFLIFILKKIKVFIVCTLLFTLLWMGARTIPLVTQYVTYNEPTTSEGNEEFTASDLPYRFAETRLLYVDSIYVSENNVNVDRTSNLLNLFVSLANTNTNMNQQKDLFYEEAKKIDAEDRQKLYKMNYRTKQVFTLPFDFQAFRNYYSVQVEGGNVISITVTTPDKELSAKMCESLEKSLVQGVKETWGDYKYKQIGLRSNQTLPTPDTGLIPRTEPTSTSVVTGTRPSVSEILKNMIKSAVWGFLAGAMISLLILFLMQATNITVLEVIDIKDMDLSVLGVCEVPEKKRKLKWIDRLIDRLEGRCAADMTPDCCAEIVAETIFSLNFQAKKILVSGVADQKVWESAARPLKTCLENKEYAVEMVNRTSKNSDAIRKIGEADGVILLEEAGVSTKQEIQREIEQCSLLNKPVFGVVLLK